MIGRDAIIRRTHEVVKRALFLLCAALALFAGAANAESYGGAGETVARSLDHEGRSRTYRVYTPPALAFQPAPPAVILLHGRTGTGEGMEYMTEMNAVADANGFIAIYPDGIGNEWTEHLDLVDRSMARGAPDDVSFLSALADEITRNPGVDRSRIYLGGFSNGGFMTMRVACLAPDMFAAYAVVGGGLHTVIAQRCNRGASPVLLMHGDDDGSIPYRGVATRESSGRRVSLMMSAPDTARFLMRRNNCQTSGVATVVVERGQSPGTTVQKFEANGCDAGKEIVFYTVLGGGHTWPGVGNLPEGLGPTNMDINAGEVIWQFFSTHRRAN